MKIFLYKLDTVTSIKFHIKIKLLINNEFEIELIALFNSGADLSLIAEGLIPTKYFYKTTHGVRYAGGERLEVNYKLSKVYIRNNQVCIPETFMLVKNLSSEMILGTSFIKKIFPINRIDDKGIKGTYKGDKVYFEFITEHFSRIVNEIKDKITRKESQINFLKSEVNTLSIDEKLKNDKINNKRIFIRNM